MGTSLSKIGQIVKGTVIGNISHIITGVASFEDAQHQHITFADSPKFLKEINSSKAGAIIVPETYNGSSCNLVKVKNPRLAFAKLLEFFNPEETTESGINMPSFIDKSVNMRPDVYIGSLVYIGKKTKIGKNSKIYPGTVIGPNVIIGNDVIIHPNVTIMKNCRVGNNVTIHSGTVIGADGFGFVSNRNGYTKIPHIGIVQIDNDVEIGACNTIDRATIGKTWIKSGAKTDNMVHIGHNVTIGKNTLIISNVAIAGSSIVGDNVILAGKAGVAGHLNIGNNAIIGPKSGVVKDIAEGEIVSGSPSMPHKQWLKVQQILPTLPNIIKIIRKLRKRVGELESKQKKLN